MKEDKGIMNGLVKERAVGVTAAIYADVFNASIYSSNLSPHYVKCNITLKEKKLENFT